MAALTIRADPQSPTGRVLIEWERIELRDGDVVKAALGGTTDLTLRLS
ncbi:MAG: hypothetical protein OXH19_02335 [Chloroflexi bacterium]|nr:hypothetical protein [Chloroflexota bacterium]MCY3587776.1 hypothetical protein [Chloroflexota bacterium]MDE2709016.1 hypothetical protein [Chloroflexota bacterium]